MNARARKLLLEEAMLLPEEERAELAADLISSLDGPTDPDVEAAWRVEIERRVQDAEAGRGVSHPIDESFARIRANLRPR